MFQKIGKKNTWMEPTVYITLCITAIQNIFYSILDKKKDLEA
jgi:hypothetical protein